VVIEIVLDDVKKKVSSGGSKFSKENTILDCEDRNPDDEDRLSCDVIRREDNGQEVNEGHVVFERTGKDSFRSHSNDFTEKELEDIENIFAERWAKGF